MTIQSTANAFLAAFTTGTRTDGTTYVCLRDGSPEWMTDAIYEAHGGMLPNDGIYERCQDALRHIADTGSDDAHEWADADVSVYHAVRVAWLAESPISRLNLCDEANEEYGGQEGDISDRIARGWYMESERLYMALYNACDLNDVDEAA